MLKENFKIQDDYYSKAPNWLLFLGILFCVAGYVLTIVYGNTITHNEPINQNILQFPKIVAIIIVSLFVPFIEEMAYRGWQNTKRIPFKLLSIGLIIAYSYATGLNLIALLLIDPILIFLILYKPNRQRRIAAIITTSILFSLMHWGNYNTIDIKIYANLVIFGLALVFSYVTWRFGLIWAILLHAVNNYIAIKALEKQEGEITNYNNYTIKSKATFGCEDENYFSKDSITYCGPLYNLPEVIVNDYLFHPDYNYQYITSIGKLELNVTVKFHDTVIAYYQDFLQLILQQHDLTIDTITEPLYHLKIQTNDTINLAKGYTKNEIYCTNLENLKFTLARNFGIIFTKNLTDKSITVKLPFKFVQMRDDISRDYILLYLKKQKQIEVKEDSTARINIIKLKELNKE